jgi:hypothetical protein
MATSFLMSLQVTAMSEGSKPPSLCQITTTIDPPAGIDFVFMET